MVSGFRNHVRPAVIVAVLIVALVSAYQFLGPGIPVVGVPGRPAGGSADLSLPGDVVRQESEIEVSASGFLPGEQVTLRAAVSGERPRDFAQVTANDEGNLAKTSVPLPEWLTSGVHRVEAVGERSGRSGEGELQVRAKGPWVNLDEHSARQGSRFALVAGGFEPHERIKVSLLPREGVEEPPVELGELVADRVGNGPWTELMMPITHDEEPAPATGAAAGVEEEELVPNKPDWWEQDLLLRGTKSGLELNETITVVRFKPMVELSPWYGPPGARIDINAQGFLPGEAVLVEYLAGARAEPAATVQADEYGNLWGAGPVRVPYEVMEGDLNLRLTGEESQVPVEAKLGVTAPQPWVELSSWSGYAGTGIIFSGGGWAAEERVVAHLGSASGPVVAMGQSDENGWLRGLGPATVPDVPANPLAKPDAARTVTYVLVGERSGAQASAEFALIVPFFEFERQTPDLPLLTPEDLEPPPAPAPGR